MQYWIIYLVQNPTTIALYMHIIRVNFDIYLMIAHIYSHPKVTLVKTLRNTSGAYLGFEIYYGKGGRSVIKLRDS